ncbi:MAG: isopentenyl-diphosphate Delta-isomerase [Chitinophagales bacterium]|nr:isopentenyl-diphosphate Delta-isomerase [Chitinophagales bacterium]
MTEKPEYVILVDATGKKTGIEEKLTAHQKGLLHRAFSIFIFNHNKEILLQRRAYSKYHFAGLWTNACCSHPGPGEKILHAAIRRLNEELGIAASLQIKEHITYSFTDEKSGLIENEFDYLLTGTYNGRVAFNKEEVESIEWVSVPVLQKRINETPQHFTPWFLMAMEKADLIFSD